MKRFLLLLAGLVVSAGGNSSGVTDPRPFRQTGPHHLVSIEAENWHTNVAIAGMSWMADATLGYSGTGALVALPNTGVEVTTNVNATSPRLEYEVNFVARGWHRIWVRGFGQTPSDDSVWVGIDGVPATTVAITSGAWGWSNENGMGNARIRVPSAGVHTLTIWMREDGTKIDKLVLVDDRFEPCGLGPDESPHDPALDAAYENYVRTLPTRCDPVALNQPPVVSAGPDQEITHPQTTVTLSGAVSDDGLPAGTLFVAWTQVSGPGDVVFSAPNSPVTSATIPAIGSYLLRLTATDGALVSTDDVNVTMHPRPNQPPVVSAGPDQETSQPQMTVTLSGTVSDDGLPAGTLSVFWSQISGPAGVVFSAPNSPVTSATFPSIGTYALRLTASDGALISTDDAGVIVHPPPDLRVDAVTAPSVDPQTLLIVGPGTITYTNVGGPTLVPYEILVWEDRNDNGVFDAAVDNLLGSATGLARLNGGETKTLEVALAGQLLFAGNVIYAWVDSGNALIETDEINNIGSSAPTCQVRGPERAFAPVVKWAWTATGAVPASREVVMSPAVADLTGDGVPDVVFSTFATSDVTGNLRAVDGRTGAELWTITNPAHAVYARSQLAIANIDADPQPEIVAYGNGGPTLAPGDSVIVFEHDGTFKWEADLNQAQLWGGPAVADLDGDGTPEIAAGRIVINADGTTRWIGALGSGAFTHGPLAVIADLDMDGSREIITGRQAYRADGTTMWQNTGVADGADVIANLDGDNNPEVVVAGSGTVWVLEHTGTTKYSFSTSGLGGQGGPVTIADFDNDGIADIGRAGSTAFGVYRGSDGMLLWTAPIAAVQSHSISAAAFDLDGDGTREAVLTDEWGMRILRGSDGVPLAEERLGMCTGYTMPVISDIDADGRADIVTGANTSCGLGNTQYGVYVYSDDIWRGAGPIWNQHTYHITNVNDDTTIPAQEPASWLLDNSYRAAATASCPFSIPDLTASHLRVTTVGSATRLTVRIGNAGARTVPRSVAVAFYDGDPRAGGVLLDVGFTSIYLEGGLFEDVSIDVTNLITSGTIWVAADNDGTGGSRIYELNEANNLFDSDVRLP
jgi:Gylcosyl hydrolase family 115 C-terminal domain/K319L-like, PKD domain/FG-GAP-like repeat